MKKSTSKITQEGFVRDAIVSWPNVAPLSGKSARIQDDDAKILGNISMQSENSSPFPSFSSPFYSSLEEDSNTHLRALEEELLSPFDYGNPVFNFSPASPSIPPSNPSISSSSSSSMHVNTPKMYNFSVPSQNNIQNINPNPQNVSMAYGNNFMPSNHSPLNSTQNFAPRKLEANLVNGFGINSTTMPNTLNMADNAFVTTSSHVSPAIADRQKKLEKYRQKRTKRKSYGDNTKRSQAASSRLRDELGHFIPEKKMESLNGTPVSSAPSTPVSSNSIHDVISLLFESKRESYELKTKLALVFDEMLTLRQKAVEESLAKDEIKKQLENQQKINNMLLQQNRLLWSTVPHNEVFSTIKAGAIPAFNVNAFKEKVDLSKIDLNWTNSPHLEAAKAEEHNFNKRWEEMNFLMGAIHPPQDSSNSS